MSLNYQVSFIVGKFLLINLDSKKVILLSPDHQSSLKTLTTNISHKCPAVIPCSSVLFSLSFCPSFPLRRLLTAAVTFLSALRDNFIRFRLLLLYFPRQRCPSRSCLFRLPLHTITEISVCMRVCECVCVCVCASESSHLRHTPYHNTDGSAATETRQLLF